MPNYVALAATAKRLVDAAGRNVTLVQLDFDTTGQKAWRAKTNPRETPAQTIVLKSAFVPLSSTIQLGLSKETLDLAKKAAALCLVGSTLDLSVFHELVDSKDGRIYKITKMEVLAPGDVTLLTFMVLNS